MKNLRLYLLASLAIFFLLPSCGSSRKTLVVEEGWEVLGERKVNFVRDRDEIDVTSANEFTSIKFYVQDRDVRISNLTITYDNGDKLNPSIDEVVPKDQYSREIELGREGRRVDKINFKYRTPGNLLKGRANVIIFGRKKDRYRY